MRFFRPLKPVKALTFDLDDTLYDNGPVIRRAEQHLAEHIGQRFPKAAALQPAQWQTIKRQLISEQPALASDMGQLRLQTLQMALREDLPGEEELQQAAKDCFERFYFARSELTIDDPILATLKTLSDHFPLIGITNGNVDPQRIGIAPYFTAMLHANVSRPMKPHPHMFEEAVQMLGLKPEQVLHVGDNLEKDVYGAIAAGLQAAWYAADRPMQLNAEPATVLPHIQLGSFEDLLRLI